MIMRRFQSTLPMRGATRRLRARPRSPDAISIHAPRAGSDPVLGDLAREAETISIHAPRAGSDLFRHYSAQQYENFNPRSPCGERPKPIPFPNFQTKFQSTLPMRGATFLPVLLPVSQRNFNPRSPCGERLYGACCCGSGRSDFNPRSPCGERPPTSQELAAINQFQSTLPMRGATATKL